MKGNTIGEDTIQPIIESTHHMVWYVSCSVVSDSLRPYGLSLPGPSVHGISQVRILDWDAISFSGESSRSRIPTWVSCIAGGLVTSESHSHNEEGGEEQH